MSVLPMERGWAQHTHLAWPLMWTFYNNDDVATGRVHGIGDGGLHYSYVRLGRGDFVPTGAPGRSTADEAKVDVDAELARRALEAMTCE